MNAGSTLSNLYIFPTTGSPIDEAFQARQHLHGLDELCQGRPKQRHILQSKTPARVLEDLCRGERALRGKQEKTRYHTVRISSTGNAKKLQRYFFVFPAELSDNNVPLIVKYWASGQANACS